MMEVSSSICHLPSTSSSPLSTSSDCPDHLPTTSSSSSSPTSECPDHPQTTSSPTSSSPSARPDHLPSSSFSSSSPPSSASPDHHPTTSSSSSSSLVLLLDIPIRRLCLCALVPPVVGIFGVFLLAYWLHRDELLDYQWICGVARLPSVSRVLNLPAERLLWHVAVALHFPLRPLISLHYFFQWPSASSASYRKNTSSTSSSASSPLIRRLLLASSLGDHLTLLGLSFVGEREHAQLHVWLFSLFLFLSFFHFTLHTLSSLPRRRVPPAARRLRVAALCALCALVPLVILSFTVHQLFCVDYTYELFVIGEYLTIATIFIFNGAVLLDNHANCGYAIFLMKRSKGGKSKFPEEINDKIR